MAVSHWKAGSRRQESRRESRKKSGALGESCACRVDILLFFIRFISLVFFSLVSATLRLCEVESVTKIILYIRIYCTVQKIRAVCLGTLSRVSNTP